MPVGGVTVKLTAGPAAGALRQRQVALADDVLIGHRGDGVGVERLAAFHPEGDLGAGADEFEFVDPADPHPGHPDVVAGGHPGGVGEDRRVGVGGAGDIAAQRVVDHPGHGQRECGEDRHPNNLKHTH